ncbi:MarR family transcriptional regulator [Gordonia sp. Z-3]|uniref:MarR family transcriptional regulator n=1 Tax=Gordonia tangerina TaxID=2911060 RepID=A0ABS9DFY9_9ACTN|nr:MULTISPECIES: MarR family transcriptional regulator [Gordonia]MAU80970.1 MarR family transcriptional regulator [Gordonia sp. (in: high G+C Gram-positive bacteria)]MCF3936783.1 MarR family transcriptional regulator [Gordonia tangerina]MED5801037.1 MarR family transcriptional regulator [Gordonia sp. Z-3]
MSDDETFQLASALRPTVTRLYLTLRRRTPIAEYSAAQASALAVLLDHGPMRMGELAERESIRMPTATALIDGLTKNGLVERTPDPADRRAVLVGLTDHGRDLLDRVRGRRDSILTAALAELSDDDRAALTAAAPALEALRHQLESLPNPEAADITAE